MGALRRLHVPGHNPYYRNIQTAFSPVSLLGLGQDDSDHEINPAKVASGAVGVESGALTMATAQTPAGMVQGAGAIAEGGLTMGAGIAGWTSIAVPIIGAIIAGVTIGLMALLSRKGPKQKMATTKIVNDVELGLTDPSTGQSYPGLKHQLADYQSQPIHTVSMQAQYLENFKAAWGYVVTNCGEAAMGNPGQACIRDRDRGGKWDWWVYYYDPVANDATVVADCVITNTCPGDTTAGTAGTVGTAGTAGELLDSTMGGIPTALLLAGGLAIAAVVMGGRS
jgi:hypothetical protein